MAAATPQQQTDVCIVGGGLAGCLMAVYLSQRGHKVDIYEKRSDWRGGAMTGGRSINLSLSARGLSALRKAGVEDVIRSEGIPMYGRLLHGEDGKLTYQPYGLPHQYNLSVSRQMMNEQLLSAAQRQKGVSVHFDERCDKVDLNNTSVTFTNMGTKSSAQINAKVICGADGAFSQVREAMTHTPRFDFSQKYLDHGYKELCIPATKDGEYALKDWQALHIWPRGDFMMIALPNKDKSFTCTLFMPNQQFAKTKTDADIMAFFERYFKDAIPVMPTLIEDWHRNPDSFLVMVSCSPFHYKNTFIIGDAAHAMVPFYGQGMNASLQDVEVFCDLLDAANGDLVATLPRYTEVRKPDADAVCRLSYDNYHVMRAAVRSRMWIWRKNFEIYLGALLPSKFIPLYTMVSFSTIPYSKVIERAQEQDKLLDKLFVALPSAAVIVAAITATRFANEPPISHALNWLRSLKPRL